MNMVKIYDAAGNHVDSYRKPQKKAAVFGRIAGGNENTRQRIILRTGKFTKRSMYKNGNV